MRAFQAGTPRVTAPAKRFRPPLCAVSAVKASIATRSLPRSTRYFQRGDLRPVILFDGVCNLCNGAVDFMLDHDTDGRFRMAALQSTAGRTLLESCGRRPDDISSIVLVEPDGHYVKSEAVLRIAKGLGVPLQALSAAALPLPLWFRDTFYDQVADNRYRLLGKKDRCRLSDERFEERFIAD